MNISVTFTLATTGWLVIQFGRMVLTKNLDDWEAFVVIPILFEVASTETNRCPVHFWMADWTRFDLRITVRRSIGIPRGKSETHLSEANVSKNVGTFFSSAGERSAYLKSFDGDEKDWMWQKKIT